MLLAGDIGASKTRLALFRRVSSSFTREHTETFASEHASGLPELLQRFMRSHPVQIEAACFGAPGPVIEGEVNPTNLSWDISDEQIRAALGIETVRLVNDLVATAAAIPYLPEEQLCTLHPGTATAAREKRCVALAPGTGLGQAFLVVRDRRWRVYPSEGGHIDFAPGSDTEIELLRHLLRKFPRVSYERVLSGPGMENIYEFLKETIYRSEPAELTERFKREDRAKVISQAGMEGTYEIAQRAVDLFVTILGHHAGNLALSFRANGGVYLGGGIPPKMLPALKGGATVRAFLEKDRMSEFVERVPLRVILDDHAALLGAAALAADLLDPLS